MKDAKGHGSEAHSAGVNSVGQALQPHLMPVPPNSMPDVDAHIKAGGALGVTNNYNAMSTISGKLYNQWANAGKPLFKPEGDGYRMRSGKSSVYLFPSQLRYVRSGK